ncbi:MAG: 4a-hydroxytetrahydrobiopterin dehydratase [Ignavibacteriaceae bacterium]|nr:4a-hydroxytetrahydrobiopterin dehydratase [Ignavibacteriaceae bacterium]
MKLLSSNEIDVALTELKNWIYNQNSFEKEFVLADFLHVLSLVNQVGNAAEEMNHHPDIFIHSWNKVKFILSTHSKGGITELDILLAKKIEEVSKK